MSTNNEGANFWSSLPRILKGLAAIITAATGLITVLYAIGYFEDRNKGQIDEPSIPKYTSLSGQWDSTAAIIPDNGSKTIACVELTQSDNVLTGVIKYDEVRYASGTSEKLRENPTGTIKGLVKGSDVEINYVNPARLPGTAHLSISSDGKNLNGSWTNNTTKATGSWIWKKRDSACPR